MTAALYVVLALAAGWYICHRIGRNLRRAAVTAERLARPYPDPAPMPDWERLAEQAAIDDTFADMIRHYNQEPA
ncbi:hypothetical protein OG342_07085 [Streptomyces bobili]|uniref:hypothetical protein n=1 Tax=Streptomyces bobili TaxID=67280 RepID=UPI002250BB9F|nr:hypothetical protein [Streptomyces bobili]MCX5522628.1 hypothetical protein [Streptomyces bobili]